MSQTLSKAATYWYVDIAAVRIQTWLGRTASLRLRRGASYALASVTSREVINRLAGLNEFRWTEDAGEISGVVPLRVATDNLSEADARELATRTAYLVAEHIRQTLPTCPLIATWGHGASYVEGYFDMSARAGRGDVLLELAGDSDELPLARPCGGCRQARAAWAEVQITDENDRLDVCPDCGARFARAGRSKVGHERLSEGKKMSLLPASQRDLIERLNGLLDMGLESGEQSLDRFPKDFADMANRGDHRAGDTPTQLALIFADGNGIGALMKHWAVDQCGYAALDPSQQVPKDHIVEALDTSTKLAIVEATRTAFSRWLTAPVEPDTKRPAPPVLVHVAGGDDVMVSVPASHAWEFARALSSEFTAQCGTTCPDSAEAPPLLAAFGPDRLPTLSIGMVFHHLSHPFADVVEKAEHQLALAKGATRVMGGATDQPSPQTTPGSGPSIPPATLAFHDLTADGEVPPADEAGGPRRPVTLTWLDQHTDPLSQLAAASRAHRATLLQLLRECREQSRTMGGAAEPSDGAGDRLPEDPAGALARRVVEVGSPAVLEVISAVSPGLVSTDDVRGALEQRRDLRDDLRSCLDIARHWPPGHGKPLRELQTSEVGQA